MNGIVLGSGFGTVVVQRDTGVLGEVRVHQLQWHGMETQEWLHGGGQLCRQLQTWEGEEGFQISGITCWTLPLRDHRYSKIINTILYSNR